MKNKTILPGQLFLMTMLAIFLLVNPGCQAEIKHEEERPSTDDMMTAAVAVDSLYQVHFNNGDLDGLMSIHWNSPELISYPTAEMKVKGFDAVKELYRKDFENFKGAKLEYVEVHNVPVDGVIMGHGIFKWSYAKEGAAPEEFTGRYSDVKAFREVFRKVTGMSPRLRPDFSQTS